MSVTRDEVEKLAVKSSHFRKVLKALAISGRDMTRPGAEWETISAEMDDSTVLLLDHGRLENDFLASKYVRELKGGNPAPDNSEGIRDMYDRAMDATRKAIEAYEMLLEIAGITLE